LRAQSAGESKMKTIEYVCTGNQGRSPVAELIARNYLRKRDALRDYNSASSGTLVDAIKANNMPEAFMLTMIGVAKSRGDVYSPAKIQDIDDIIHGKNIDAIKYYFGKAQERFVAEERQFRLEILPLLGIEGELKRAQEQTIVRPNALAVLSMAEGNNKQVAGIYATTEPKPVIDTLARCVGKGIDIPNAFGLPKEMYVATVERLVELVPISVDKLLR